MRLQARTRSLRSLAAARRSLAYGKRVIGCCQSCKRRGVVRDVDHRFDSFATSRHHPVNVTPKHVAKRIACSSSKPCYGRQQSFWGQVNALPEASNPFLECRAPPRTCTPASAKTNFGSPRSRSSLLSPPSRMLGAKRSGSAYQVSSEYRSASRFER